MASLVVGQILVTVGRPAGRLGARSRAGWSPADPTKGLVVHLVVKSDGGLRHFNVWESKQDRERYRHERIGPAVGKVLAAVGVTQRPPEPVEQQLEVVDVWTGA
jgi:hypothetical protein